MIPSYPAVDGILWRGLICKAPKGFAASIEQARTRTRVPDGIPLKEGAMFEESEEKRTYRVVVNHEEQYSIWPSGKEIPAGWKDGGKTGSKQECLAFIKEIWTDMTPLSLREKMRDQRRQAAAS